MDSVDYVWQSVWPQAGIIQGSAKQLPPAASHRHLCKTSACPSAGSHTVRCQQGNIHIPKLLVCTARGAKRVCVCSTTYFPQTSWVTHVHITHSFTQWHTHAAVNQRFIDYTCSISFPWWHTDMCVCEFVKVCKLSSQLMVKQAFVYMSG